MPHQACYPIGAMTVPPDFLLNTDGTANVLYYAGKNKTLGPAQVVISTEGTKFWPSSIFLASFTGATLTGVDYNGVQRCGPFTLDAAFNGTAVNPAGAGSLVDLSTCCGIKSLHITAHATDAGVTAIAISSIRVCNMW